MLVSADNFSVFLFSIFVGNKLPLCTGMVCLRYKYSEMTP